MKMSPKQPQSLSYIISKWQQGLALIILMLALVFISGCSSTTLPWPDLSISRDEAEEALTKEEQSLLEELLTAQQKNHEKEAVREIETR